jgi:transposase
MQYIRGKPLEPGEKRAIVSLKAYFDRNKKEFGLTDPSVQLTADALEMGLSTVKRVMADYRRDPLLLNKPPEPKGRQSYAIDCSHEEMVRSFIRNANRNGQYITIATLSELIQNKEYSFSSCHFGKGARSLGVRVWQRQKIPTPLRYRRNYCASPKIFTAHKSKPG